MFLMVKYLITAAIIIFVSEVAKSHERLGGLLAALPLMTVLILIWLHIDQQPVERIANHAWYTFWYVLPTLPMFLLFPSVITKIGFWWSLLLCAVVTLVCFVILALILKRFQIFIW